MNYSWPFTQWNWGTWSCHEDQKDVLHSSTLYPRVNLQLGIDGWTNENPNVRCVTAWSSNVCLLSSANFEELERPFEAHWWLRHVLGWENCNKFTCLEERQKRTRVQTSHNLQVRKKPCQTIICQRQQFLTGSKGFPRFWESWCCDSSPGCVHAGHFVICLYRNHLLRSVYVDCNFCYYET